MADNSIQPLNYNLQVPDPNEAVRKNLESVSAIRYHALQAAELQQKLHLQKLGEQQQKDFYTAYQQVAKNPTSEGVSSLMAMPGAGPHIAAIQDRYKALREDEQMSVKATFGSAYNAASSGRVDIAQRQLEEAAIAAKNSGLTRIAQGYAQAAQSLKENPELGAMNIAFAARAVDPKFSEDTAKLQETQYARKDRPMKERELAAKVKKDETDADMEKKVLGAQIAAQEGAGASAQATAAATRYKLDIDKKNEKLNRQILEYDTKIKQYESENKEKALKLENEKKQLENDQFRLNMGLATPKGQEIATEKAQEQDTHEMAARGLTRLYDNVAKFKKQGITQAGWGDYLTEAAKGALGKGDQYSLMQEIYNNTVNKEIELGASSHGAAALIELRKSGFPPPTASREVLLGFVDKLRKAREELAKNAKFESYWANYSSRNPVAAEKSFQIDGYEIRKGDTRSSVRKRMDNPEFEQQVKEARALFDPKDPHAARALKYFGDRGVNISG